MQLKTSIPPKQHNLEVKLRQQWWAAWNSVIQHNHQRTNLYAAGLLFVEAALPNHSTQTKLAVVSKIVRQLQHLPIPLSHPTTLQVLEQLTQLAPTSIWTTGDLGNSHHHTLPASLFGSTLPGSQEQIYKVIHAGIYELQKKVGADHLTINIALDKFTNLLSITNHYIALGKKFIVIIEDRLENLARIDQILSIYPTLPALLLLVNQGRHKLTSTPSFNPTHPLHTFEVVNSFPETQSRIASKILYIPTVILCDFDGVITDNNAYSKLQENAACQIVETEVTTKTVKPRKNASPYPRDLNPQT